MTSQQLKVSVQHTRGLWSQPPGHMELEKSQTQRYGQWNPDRASAVITKSQDEHKGHVARWASTAGPFSGQHQWGRVH